MNNLISLVTTVYNREKYLAEAIQSVLNSEYQNFEYLIWDDGSTDNSLKIAKQFAQQDDRIRVIASEHRGRGYALKLALEETKGVYLGLIDSDDLITKTTLTETECLLSSDSQLGMVYTDYLVIDINGQVRGLGKRCQIPYSPQRLLVDFMTFHFRLIRREVYQKVGGINPEFSAAQDYDLCLKLSEVTKIEHLSKPLYYYRHHSENISHQRQLEQIHFTQRAINEALQRRNLASKLELTVEIRPRYILKKRV